MKEDDGDRCTVEENLPPRFRSKSKADVNPTKSLVRFQTLNVGHCSELPIQQRFSSPTETRLPKHKPIPSPSGKEEDAPSDFWRPKSSEAPLELVELHNGRDQEEWRGRTKRGKLEENGLSRHASGGALEVLSYTKEFHVLSEVQKARILTAIEDTIKKLANSDFKDFAQQENHGRCHETSSFHERVVTAEKDVCKKFLLPWAFMKVLEMIVCHIIQLTFLSNDSYFQRKNEFLPVVVTFYLTLFIIAFSLLMHIICFSYAGFQHTCYFMCVVSSSILALTTALGVLIMLCSMKYYQSFREIFVLVLIGALLSCLVVELCICYVEVKSFWNKVVSTEYFLS